MSDKAQDKMTPSVKAKDASEKAAEAQADAFDEAQDGEDQYEEITTPEEDKEKKNIQDQFLTREERAKADTGNEFLDRLAANRAEPSPPSDSSSPFDGKVEKE